jgi:hypothetical protein
MLDYSLKSTGVIIMTIKNTLGLMAFFVLLTSCSGAPPSERFAKTLSAPVFTNFNIANYNECFSTDRCTDIKTEELEDKLKGKYIILSGLVEEVKGNDDPNTFRIESCVTLAGNCLDILQMGRVKLRSGGEFAFNCKFEARTYTKTESQSAYIRNLSPGNKVRVKGEVSYISSYPSCRINLKNSVVIK